MRPGQQGVECGGDQPSLVPASGRWLLLSVFFVIKKRGRGQRHTEEMREKRREQRRSEITNSNNKLNAPVEILTKITRYRGSVRRRIEGNRGGAVAGDPW